MILSAAKKISIKPDKKINFLWLILRLDIFWPKKIPSDKKIYWHIAVATGK